MEMELLPKLSDLNNLPTKIILLVWITTTIVLFLPPELITVLGLLEFKKEYNRYVGISFIISKAFLILNVGAWVIKKIRIYYLRSRVDDLLKKSLLILDEEEKSLLREFRIQRRHTISMPLIDPTVAGLVRK